MSKMGTLNIELQNALMMLRANADALVLSVDAALKIIEGASQQESVEEWTECHHPLEARHDISTMGNREFICRKCGKTISEKEHPEYFPDYEGANDE